MRKLLCVALFPAFSALLVAHTIAPAALAQSKSRTKNEAQSSARKLGEDGLRLYGEKKYAEAYEVFRSADELFHANTLVLFMGHCRRETGKLLEAREIYTRVVDEPVPKGAAEQLKKAQATAREELTKLKARIPTMKVVLSGAGADEATLKIDGLPVTASEFASGKEIDPGEHKVRAESPTAEPSEREVNLSEGGETRVEIELTAIAVAAPVEKKKGSIVPGVVVLGVGAAAAGAGAVTGLIAMSQISDIKSRCRADMHCPASDQANADGAKTLSTISTIAFIASGALLVGGAVLIVTRPGGSAAGSEKAASVHLRVGPASIGVGGSF